ncbi:unnamed protein product [Lasius platythorax]|uniref:THAP-type domain-containing protein n=1 Tax=Lasius platythorax TaxID=488582 RepID=A0AAV2NNG5_9HYME
MSGCLASFCNNSSKKGYIMKVFPKNPERRASWLQNVVRENWVLTDNSYLCEVHFSPEMWERRADHKRKLNPNAVPTIFEFFIKEKIINDISESSTLAAYVSSTIEPDKQKEDNETMVNVQNKDYQTINDISEPSTLAAYVSSTVEPDKQKEDNETNNVQNKDYQILNDISEPSTSAAYISSVDKSDKEKKCRQGRLEEIIRRQQLSLIKMRRKMKALRNTVQTLKSKVNNDKYRKALSSIFTKDQIEVLFTKRRSVRNWLNETIKRALQFKFVCGANGYEELTRQGLSLPSLRTLRRRLEYFKFEHGISDLMFKFLKHKKSYFNKETNFECGLIFDEMAITPKKCYDPSTESLIGDITFPNEEGNATHALTFMLVGIASR